MSILAIGLLVWRVVKLRELIFIPFLVSTLFLVLTGLPFLVLDKRLPDAIALVDFFLFLVSCTIFMIYYSWTKAKEEGWPSWTAAIISALYLSFVGAVSWIVLS